MARKDWWRCLAFGTMCIAAAAAAEPVSIVSSPLLPTLGDPVQIKVSAENLPVYLRTMRYSRVGYSITVDYDYLADGFGPVRPDLGPASLALGELAPGNYSLTVRLSDLAHPGSAPQVATTNLPVAPPVGWGIYSVPQMPGAFEPVDFVIRSAAYFDPTTMGLSISGNVIRVYFEYYADSPTTGASIPAGATSFASVHFAGLPPGSFTLEGWGRPKGGGTNERFFSRDIGVSTVSHIVEYYAAALDHYFISGNPAEIDGLDSGASGGWQRTGQRLKGWLRPQDAPAEAAAVCRFYSRGSNSHFYTINTAECQYLQTLESVQRDQAAAAGVAFTGWQYEGTAFFAIPAQQGQCPAGTDPVSRAYNMRGAESDANHRYTVDPTQRAMMALVWADEGIAFCSPQ